MMRLANIARRVDVVVAGLVLRASASSGVPAGITAVSMRICDLGFSGTGWITAGGVGAAG